MSSVTGPLSRSGRTGILRVYCMRALPNMNSYDMMSFRDVASLHLWPGETESIACLGAFFVTQYAIILSYGVLQKEMNSL